MLIDDDLDRMIAHFKNIEPVFVDAMSIEDEC